MAMRFDQGLAVGQLGLAPSLNEFSLHGKGFLALSSPNYRYYVPASPSNSSYIPTDYFGVELIKSDLYNQTCGTEFKKFDDDERLTENELNMNLSNFYQHWEAYHNTKEEYENVAIFGAENETFEARKKVVYHRQEMDVATYLGYMNTVGDTLKTNNDSLRTWIYRFANLAGDYMLVKEYIKSHQFETARTVLKAIPQKYEVTEGGITDYKNVSSIFEELMNADGEISVDLMEGLQEMSELPEGQARYLARSILTDMGFFYMPSIVEIATPDVEIVDGSSTALVPKMSVSPNPTDYYVSFDWSAFKVSSEEVLIEITDQAGGLIQLLKPDQGSFSKEWTTELVSDSIIFYSLFIDGVEMDSGQIIVNK